MPTARRDREPRRGGRGRRPRPAGPRGLRACLVALVAAALLGILLPASARAASFSDVSTTDPWYSAVRYLTSANVIAGFDGGTFRPYDPVNRGQIAKILILQRGLRPATTISGTFTDIESVYGAYVLTAAAQGWIMGYADGTFRPYAPLQRQHAAVILVRSLGWAETAEGLSPARVAEILAPFADRGSIVAEARPFVALAVSRGLFGGKNGNFGPGGTITRGQFALVAYRAELLGLAVFEGVRYSADHTDRTRIVFDLSRRPGTVSTDSSQAGVAVIDVSGAAVGAAGLEADIHSPEVARVIAGQLTARPPAVRVRVDLGKAGPVQTSVLEPSDGRGYRLVVDVMKRVDPVGTAPLVCLDAGHGGQDSGAVGVTGVLEKNINLAMTLALNDYLKAAGLRTILTRADDSYPTLSQRVQIANDAKADLFVSIHNNWTDDPSANGTYTFYWGTPDNYSVEGKALAEAIQRHLVAEIGSADRGARTHWQNLYVLNNTTMVAALVEVGFLSNAREEAKLADPSYQRRAALGISKGIQEYLHWGG